MDPLPLTASSAQTPPPALPATSGAVPNRLAPATHPYTSGCTCPKCEAKRQKWRDKGKARTVGDPDLVRPVPIVPATPPMDGNGLPPADDTSFVPWTPDTLRPLFAEITPLIEAADIESLRKQAAQLSPECAALVERKAPWGEATKATIISSAAAVGAKWMNKCSISSEWLPELTLGVAVVGIISARSALKNEIRKLIEEERAAQKKPAPAGAVAVAA